MTLSVFGHIFASDLIAGVLISLIAFAVALTLLFRLAALELDRERAEVTLMLIAFCFIETRVEQPMFHLDLFKIRAFSAATSRR